MSYGIDKVEGGFAFTIYIDGVGQIKGEGVFKTHELAELAAIAYIDSVNRD